MPDTLNQKLMGTTEERFNEWLLRATEIAKELHIGIEFTTEYAGYGYDSYHSACVEVSGTEPQFGYYKHSGTTCINYWHRTLFVLN